MSLTCKLWILFWTFRDMWTLLKYYRIFGTVLYRKTGSHCLATFCWSINCITWMSFHYKKTYFRHVQKLRHYLYLRPFNAFPYTESSMLTIKHVFSFFWSGLQVVHLNSIHLRFLSSVDVGGFLLLHILKDKI